MSRSIRTRPRVEPSITDSLLEAAHQRTGLSDWGDDYFRLPLEMLLRSVEEEAHLTARGRELTLECFVDRLSNRLRVHAHLSSHPDVQNVPIPKPVIVTGLPRTGTTLLQGLLATDPAHRALQRWELFNPIPPPTLESYESDPRRTEMLQRRQSKLTGAERTQFQTMHDGMPNAYEECYVIFEHAFMSRTIPRRMNVPSYEEWLIDQDMRPAYRDHYRWLQILTSRHGGKRIVLKAPEHLYNLDQILDLHPSAQIIWTHRDPASAIASGCSLLSFIRNLRSDQVDRKALAEQSLRSFQEATNRAMRVREEHEPSRFLDVSYRRLVADPLGVVKEVYDSFGYELSAEALQRMQSWLRERPQHKHGVHRYRLEEFGLSRDRVLECLADYVETYSSHLFSA